MKLRHFVVGPEKLDVPYGPGFLGCLGPMLDDFFEAHGEWPNACYVSLRFPGELPGPLYVGEGEPVRFCRQTLLADGEILLGVEVETDLRGEGYVYERAVG